MPFLTAARVLDSAVAAADGDEVPPFRRGPVVVLPPYSDGYMLWSPVYWVALCGVIVCWRSAPSSRGLRFFRSAGAAVEWGRVV